MFRSKLFHHILENICHFALSLLLSYQIQILFPREFGLEKRQIIDKKFLKAFVKMNLIST